MHGVTTSERTTPNGTIIGKFFTGATMGNFHGAVVVLSFHSRF